MKTAAGMEYEERGSGTAVVLVHAGVFSAWFAPLFACATLDGFRVVRPIRPGYGNLPRPAEQYGLADHSRRCADLVRELGIQRAFWVGHSSSCSLLLQLAVDDPDVVEGLILFEPARPSGPVQAENAPHFIRPALAAAAQGDVAGAFDAFLTGVGGRGFRQVLETRLGAAGIADAVRESESEHCRSNGGQRAERGSRRGTAFGRACQPSPAAAETATPTRSTATNSIHREGDVPVTEPLPIVLVSGLLASARLYGEQIPQLWRYGPVTIADHTRDENIATIARRIVTAAPPSFALVGLSMGGYIAFEIMRQAADRVIKLALLNTSARPDAPEQSQRRQTQIRLAENGQFAEIPDQQFPLLVHPEHQGDETLRRLVQLMAHETGPDAFIRQQKAIMARPDSRQGLAAIGCPTLVLVGDGDQLTPPEHAAEIARGVPDSRLVIVPDCGHLSTLERPQQVTQAMVEWLQ